MATTAQAERAASSVPALPTVDSTDRPSGESDSFTVYGIHVYKDGQYDRTIDVSLSERAARRSTATYNSLSDGDGYEAKVCQHVADIRPEA